MWTRATDLTSAIETIVIGAAMSATITTADMTAATMGTAMIEAGQTTTGSAREGLTAKEQTEIVTIVATGATLADQIEETVATPLCHRARTTFLLQRSGRAIVARISTTGDTRRDAVLYTLHRKPQRHTYARKYTRFAAQLELYYLGLNILCAPAFMQAQRA